MAGEPVDTAPTKPHWRLPTTVTRGGPLQDTAPWPMDMALPQISDIMASASGTDALELYFAARDAVVAYRRASMTAKRIRGMVVAEMRNRGYTLDDLAQIFDCPYQELQKCQRAYGSWLGADNQPVVRPQQQVSPDATVGSGVEEQRPGVAFPPFTDNDAGER